MRRAFKSSNDYLREEGEKIGLLKGKEIGKEIGMEIGKEIGRKEGRDEVREEIIMTAVKNILNKYPDFSDAEIGGFLGVSSEVIAKIRLDILEIN